MALVRCGGPRWALARSARPRQPAAPSVAEELVRVRAGVRVRARVRVTLRAYPYPYP